MSRLFTQKHAWGVAALASIATVLSIFAHWEPRFPGDLRLTLLVQSAHSTALDSIMKWVSFLTGDWRAILLAAAGGLVVWRCLGRREGALVLTTWLSAPIHSVLKLLVNRPRPTPELVRVLQDAPGNSFPSGHAFFAIAFWGLLAYFAWTRLPSWPLRVLAFSGCGIIILLIGSSRVYLGAHWPSDVIGGYIFGALLLLVLICLDRMWRAHCDTQTPDEPDHTDNQPGLLPGNSAQ
ncbi:MAG: phosphatase PAP2 family protein [Dehalococcoidia bacterium]|nr:phosphatase PAP2 family protein [Dehalococcoidia bacterium]